MLVLALLAPAMATSARHRPGHELHLLANASLPLHVVSVSTTEQVGRSRSQAFAHHLPALWVKLVGAETPLCLAD